MAFLEIVLLAALLVTFIILLTRLDRKLDRKHDMLREEVHELRRTLVAVLPGLNVTTHSSMTSSKVREIMQRMSIDFKEEEQLPVCCDLQLLPDGTS